MYSDSLTLAVHLLAVDKQNMKEELKPIIENAYAACREVMIKHKGKWTPAGRAANMAFRALEVACRKLGIDTPPLAKRPESAIVYKYNEQAQPDKPNSATKDIIATSETAPKTARKSKKNDII